MWPVYFHTMLWLSFCHRKYPRLQWNLHILLYLIWFHSQHFVKNSDDAPHDTLCKALLQQSYRLIKNLLPSQVQDVTTEKQSSHCAH